MLHTDKYGLIINAAVSLGIAVVSMIVGLIIIRRQQDARTKTAGYIFSVYWLALSLLYLFVAVRTIFGYFGFEVLDKVFFYVDNVFGGLMAPSAVFLFVYLITGGKRNIALIPGLIVVGVWVVWNIINISAGAGHYQVTYWFTEWEPNSSLARMIAIAGLYAPAAISILGMNFSIIKAQSRLARYRIVLTSISMFVAFSIIIVDYLRPGPPWLRLVIMLAALLGYFAYSPPRFLHTWLEITEQKMASE